VVVFDLDGTLLRGTSASILLGQAVGRAREMAELERAFQANEISNSRASDICASWLRGLSTSDAADILGRGPWIDGIDEVLERLRASGASVLLATLSWRFASEIVRSRYELVATCGTEMEINDGVLSGVVTKHFDEPDKVRFVQDWCTQSGYAMNEVAAIGDARSDVMLFRQVGESIALNAMPEARRAADHTLDTRDLRDVLPLLYGS
jgi:phosphoserine phosphatase